MDFSAKPSRLVALTRQVSLFSLGVIALAASLHAGLVGGLGNQNSVGGVMVDAAGVVRDATIDEKRELAEMLRRHANTAEGDLAAEAKLRMVSLKGLQQAVADAKTSGNPIPADVEYLAGLQQIDYVFVDSENSDIVIAGPAEPWKLRDDGAVVGTVTGGAVMRLADLVVALQGVEQAAKDPISCSIEPTAEGRRKLQTMLRRVKLRPGQSPVGLEASMKEAYGPQMIQLTGVPTDSRYARTMVAADFEMKRVAMGLVQSPVTALPSYIEMSRNGAHGPGQNPRWWMACDYAELAKSEDAMAWKISGNRVKTMTEQDMVQVDGSVRGAGKTDKMAQLWADKMNDNFSELVSAMPVFSDLQNVMDVTVLATLIRQEGLANKAGLDLGVLEGSDSVELVSYEVPRSVSPQCSFIRGRKGWVVTASGGVDINAFEVVDNQVVAPEVSATASVALAARSDAWWWNGSEG